MNPWKVSAQFAAFVWFTSKEGGKQADTGEAVRFAKRNWPAFVSCADDGIGRLLIRIARPRALGTARSRQRITHTHYQPRPAMAC
jgi:hypothetical protein